MVCSAMKSNNLSNSICWRNFGQVLTKYGQFQKHYFPIIQFFEHHCYTIYWSITLSAAKEEHFFSWAQISPKINCLNWWFKRRPKHELQDVLTSVKSKNNYVHVQVPQLSENQNTINYWLFSRFRTDTSWQQEIF